MDASKLKTLLCLLALFVLGYLFGLQVGAYVERAILAERETRRLLREIESQFVPTKKPDEKDL